MSFKHQDSHDGWEEKQLYASAQLEYVPQPWLVNTLPMKACSLADQTAQHTRQRYISTTMRHQRSPLKVRAAHVCPVPQYVFPDDQQVM